jgi:hypothetical protein
MDERTQQPQEFSMSGEQRCSYCQQAGHNKRSCSERQQHLDFLLTEFAEEVDKHAELIRQLQQDLPPESAAQQQELLTRLRLDNAKIRGMMKSLVKDEERNQPIAIRTLPAAMALVSAALVFLGCQFDRIPHAETIALVVLALVPGLVTFVVVERIRKMMTWQRIKRRLRRRSRQAARA